MHKSFYISNYISKYTRMIKLKNIRINACNLRDVSKLQEIGRKTFYETYKDNVSKKQIIDYLKNSFSYKQIVKDIKDKDSRLFLVQYNNKLIGYIKLNFTQLPDLGDALEIERMYLLKEYKGKHIGKKLMEKSIALAKANKSNYVWLGVWEKNTDAIRFYKKCGFRKYGAHLFNLGKEKHIDNLMRRHI